MSDIMTQSQENSITSKESVKPISIELTYIYVYFAFVSFIISLFSFREDYSSSDAGLLFNLTAMILSYILLYKIWNCLQDEDVRATGGAAVFYLFIPFYNIYWVFQAYLGWALDFNKVRAKFQLTSPKMPVLLGLATSIAPFLVIISFVLSAIVFAKLAGENQFYVRREGKSVRIVHQAQLQENEQLYKVLSPSKMSLPVSHKAAPTEQEYKAKYHKYLLYHSILILPYFCFSMVNVLFFLKASSCINKLYQKQCSLKQNISYAALGSFILAASPVCVSLIFLSKYYSDAPAYTTIEPGIFYFLIIIYIVAFVLGFKALRNIKKSGGLLHGRGLALTVTAISSIFFLIALTALLALLITGDSIGSPKHSVMITKNNLRSLQKAVWQHFKDTSKFPTKEEGLDILLKKATNDSNEIPVIEQDIEDKQLSKEAERDKQLQMEIGIIDFKYLESAELPKDGWGRYFIYKKHPKSGVPFVILSLGADGKEGGKGHDADILSTDLE